jgi:hypothetical protein
VVGFGSLNEGLIKEGPCAINRRGLLLPLCTKPFKIFERKVESAAKSEGENEEERQKERREGEKRGKRA